LVPCFLANINSQNGHYFLLTSKQARATHVYEMAQKRLIDIKKIKKKNQNFENFKRIAITLQSMIGSNSSQIASNLLQF
jgi:penicillin-binding protein-related factor A (putative recombinase)